LIVPELYAWCGAIGTAILESEDPRKRSFGDIHRLRQHEAHGGSFDSRPLSMDSVNLLRDRVVPYTAPPGDAPIPAYLGIDIGSVSTNVVVIDEQGRLVQEIYLRTAGRPIEAVQQGLTEVASQWGSRLEVLGVGATGSGRELVAEFVGADVVNDEITAHKTGALNISRSLGGEPVDTIFEIGGQDSKFISIENGVVVDFAMNEACAAGTGSFLEEQAEKLGVNIKGEFARLALSADAPTRLGERCTVFMDASGRNRSQPAGRPGLFDRAQLPEPRRERPQNRESDLLPGRYGVQRRRGRGLRPRAGAPDYGAAPQRRDRRHRHGPYRPRMAKSDRR
jgi:predicted CoA-substrate-specific enzyme activase